MSDRADKPPMCDYSVDRPGLRFLGWRIASIFKTILNRFFLLLSFLGNFAQWLSVSEVPSEARNLGVVPKARSQIRSVRRCRWTHNNLLLYYKQYSSISCVCSILPIKRYFQLFKIHIHVII